MSCEKFSEKNNCRRECLFRTLQSRHTASERRYSDVILVFRRRFNVVLTSCVRWVRVCMVIQSAVMVSYWKIEYGVCVSFQSIQKIISQIKWRFHATLLYVFTPLCIFYFFRCKRCSTFVDEDDENKNENNTGMFMHSLTILMSKK